MDKLGGDSANPVASPESFNCAAEPVDAQTQLQDDDHVVEEAREKVYFLDGASALAAYVLGARRGDVTLDMCAAPGGKSLIISCMIFSASIPPYFSGAHSVACSGSYPDKENDEGGLLVCNDVSRERLARLQTALRRFLPGYLTAGQRLQFSCADVCKGGPFERFAPYDKILLDAPCSSDRHLLRKAGSAIVNWSPKTPKAHAERQIKMLLVASKLLKRNGVLLYTTCSLSDTENDAVIERFLKKAKVTMRILPLFDGEWPPEVKLLDGTASQLKTDLFSEHGQSPALFLVEKLKYGYAVLPDLSKFGPMYFCKMQLVGH